MLIAAASVDGGGSGGSVYESDGGWERYGPRIGIRNIKPIRKGEEITIAYTDLLQTKDILGDDFKIQGSHVPYNVADFSTQIPSLAWNRSEIEKRVHTMMDKFAERGLRSLAVALRYLRTPRTVLVSPGNSSALCLSLIHLSMTVLKQLEEL